MAWRRALAARQCSSSGEQFRKFVSDEVMALAWVNCDATTSDGRAISEYWRIIQNPDHAKELEGTQLTLPRVGLRIHLYGGLKHNN